jgi:hypothetical protein
LPVITKSPESRATPSQKTFTSKSPNPARAGGGADPRRHPGDGRWFESIDDAEQIERRQWEEFEERFRNFHEQSLAYRFLPETDEERAVVIKHFPELTIEGKKGPLTVDHESIRYAVWPAPIAYSEITNCALDNDTLVIQYTRDGKQKAKLPLKPFASRKQEAIQVVNQYYSRFLNAQAYRKQKQEEVKAEAE